MLKPPAIHGGKNTDVQSFSGTDAAGSTPCEFFAQAKTLEAEKCTRMSDHKPDRMSGGSILAMFCRMAKLEAQNRTRMSDFERVTKVLFR